MLKQVALIILSALLVVVFPVQAGQSKLQPLSEKQRASAQSKSLVEEGAKNRSGSENAPLFIKLVVSKSDKQKAQKEAEERQAQAATEQQLSDYTLYLAIATVALVFVAASQAVLFYWQLIYMGKGLKDTAEAARAATTQANIAQRTFEKLERPYVYIFGLIWLEYPDGTPEIMHPRVCCNVANFGKLPAEVRRVQVGCTINGNPDPVDLVDYTGEESVLIRSRVVFAVVKAGLAKQFSRKPIVTKFAQGFIQQCNPIVPSVIV